MSTNIADLFAVVPGLKADYKTDWIENSEVDWNIDWVAVPGGLSGGSGAGTGTGSGTGTGTGTGSGSSGTGGGGSVPAPGAPTCSVDPTITGTPAVGQTLTINLGTWAGTPPPTFTYQWFIDDFETPETGNTFAVEAACAGQPVVAVITGVNSAGALSKTAVVVIPA